MSKGGVRLNLGSVIVDRAMWERALKHGYTRDHIRQVIVQNGEESLCSALDSTNYCRKCGTAMSGSNGEQSCDHDWEQL